MATKRILPEEVVAAYEKLGSDHWSLRFPFDIDSMFRAILGNRGVAVRFWNSPRRLLGLSYWYGEGFANALDGKPRVFQEYKDYCLGHSDGSAARIALDALHKGVASDEATKP